MACLNPTMRKNFLLNRVIGEQQSGKIAIYWIKSGYDIDGDHGPGKSGATQTWRCKLRNALKTVLRPSIYVSPAPDRNNGKDQAAIRQAVPAAPVHRTGHRDPDYL